jgi:GNAT superfamily N-acetyltransferase
MSDLAAEPLEGPEGNPPAFEIRTAGTKDLNFVIGAWLENFKRESPFAHRVNHEVFFGKYRPVILTLLERSHVSVAEAEGQLVGSLVWGVDPAIGETYLHWVYVVKAQRGNGIGRAMLQNTSLPLDLAGVRVTHPTFTWFSQHTKKEIRPGIWKREIVRAGLEEKFPLAIHDPCAAFYLALSEGATE